MNAPNTSPGGDQVPIFGTFAPDSRQQTQAREALKKIRDATGDPALAESIDDVLAGRATLRELLGTPAMAGIMSRTAEVVRKEAEEMPPEDLAKLKEKIQE